MNKSKSRKTRLIIIVSVCLAVMLTVPVFAYFVKEIAKNQELGFSVDNSAVTVDIPDFNTLTQYIRYSDEYNGGAETVSDAAARRILRLTGNITLETDIIITADCHIDLNGYRLIMNGHSLTFRHNFNGNIIINGGTGGSIVIPDAPEGGTVALPEIYFDAPKTSGISFPNVSFLTANGTAYAGEKYTDISGDMRSVLYNALLLVADSLVNYSDSRTDLLDYGDLSSLQLTETDGIIAFPADLLLKNRNCTVNGTANHPCAFVFGDIDLPDRLMYRDGVTISYTSDDTATVSEHGKVTVSGAGIRTVTLTASVYQGETLLGRTPFTVHVADSTVSEQRRTVAKLMLEDYLSRFYDNTLGHYLFNRGAQLPLKFVFGGTVVSLEYHVYKDGNVEENNPGITWVTDAGNTYFTVFTPSNSAIRLDVGIDGGAPVSYVIESGVSEMIESNASIAKQFLRRVYKGDNIVVHANTDGTAFTSTVLQNPDTIAISKGISTVSYSILTDEDDIYELAQENGVDVIRWAGITQPRDSVKTVVVKCDFTFERGDPETIPMIVVCLYGEESDNVSGFMPYYTYYNTQFIRYTTGYTIENFMLPMSFGGKAFICYDIAAYDETSGTWIINQTGTPLTLSLYYNGTDHTLTAPTAGNSFTDVFNAHLRTEVLTQQELAAAGLDGNNLTTEEINRLYSRAMTKLIAYGDAQWSFKINKAMIPTDNTEYRLYYNYKLSVSDSTWIWYEREITEESTGQTTLEPMSSVLIIPGVLHKGTNEEVHDDNLYQWIYNNYSGGTYSEGKLILTDWLQQNVSFDATVSAFNSITDFAGIQYLVGSQYIDLSGKQVSLTTMGYIKQMTAVETLKLVGCSLADRASADGADNGIFNGISALSHLKELHIESNSIYFFEFLLDIPTLEKVYLYDNLDPEAADGIFYGSVGLVNYSIFQDLTDNGVQVYNTATESGGNISTMLFEESKEINDYMNLKSIAYQSKLPTGEDITALYQDLSTIPGTYNLKTSYGNNLDVSNASLVWGYLGDDPTTSETITLTYSLTVGGTAVTLVVKYGVTRI